MTRQKVPRASVHGHVIRYGNYNMERKGGVIIVRSLDDTIATTQHTWTEAIHWIDKKIAKEKLHLK